MGYVLRVRMASFFAGAATSSILGLYVLYRDYKVIHNSVSREMKNLHESLDGRISALEKLREIEPAQHVRAEATE